MFLSYGCVQVYFILYNDIVLCTYTKTQFFKEVTNSIWISDFISWTRINNN